MTFYIGAWLSSFFFDKQFIEQTINVFVYIALKALITWIQLQLYVKKYAVNLSSRWW